MVEWSNEQLKCLLDTCLEEMNRVGRRGGSMHKESWAKLREVLKERFNMNLTQKQMKNAYDNLRNKYLGYVYLRNKTGNIYNPQTNSFNLTDEEWDAFKKVYKKAGSLRTQPMPYPELCAALYDGSSASGNNQWTSTIQTTSGGTSSSAHRVQSLQIEDNPFDDLEDDEGTSAPNATDDIPPTNQEETSASRGRSSKKPRMNLNDLALDMQKALQHLIKSDGPTIDECHEKLKLVGLSPVDPLFLAAFNIFGQSSQMRESWMGLPSDPEVLKGWIKLTGKQFGIFS